MVLGRVSLFLSSAIALDAFHCPPTTVLMDLQAGKRSLEAGVELGDAFIKDGQRIGTGKCGELVMSKTADLRCSQGDGLRTTDDVQILRETNSESGVCI